MVLTGPDVSHHQGAVNWAQVAAAGHTFGLAKATEGTGFVDSQFAANFKAMRGTGLVPGAYHFLSNTSDPAAQARKFVSVVGNTSGVLCALDVETTGSGGHPTSAQAHAFAAEFARLTGGHHLILYTGRWYWVGALGNPHGADIGPLWHSAYASAPGATYGGWSEFTFWQYTSSGRCPGIGGNCDLNQFFGDRRYLLALAGAGATPAPTPEPEPPTQEQDDDDMPKKIMKMSDDPLGAWLLTNPPEWYWITSSQAAGVMVWFGQATLDPATGQPYTLSREQFQATYLVRSPGTDNPWTPENEAQTDGHLELDFNEQITLPDGTTTTLAALLQMLTELREWIDATASTTPPPTAPPTGDLAALEAAVARGVATAMAASTGHLHGTITYGDTA